MGSTTHSSLISAVSALPIISNVPIDRLEILYRQCTLPVDLQF